MSTGQDHDTPAFDGDPSTVSGGVSGGVKDASAASQAAKDAAAADAGAVSGGARDASAASQAAGDAVTPDAGADPEPRTPDPERRTPDRVRWALVAGAVLLAVLGIGLLGWAAGHQTGPPPEPAPSAAAPGTAAGPPPPPAPPPLSTVTAAPGREAEVAEPLGSSSPPVTLRIPAIRVDSPVGQVGLNPDRTMEVPAEGSPGYDHAAWFRFSVTPGRQGPSVLIGHVDSATSGPSVFFELGRLRPGDRAEVTRADGVTVTFEVTEVAVFGKDAFPTDRVYGPTRGPELRLITCSGSFDRGAGHYRDNTVVFARAVPS